MQSVKRFIAGARCTQCQQLDKIRCWHEEDRYFSECVSCGYREEMNKDGLRSEHKAESLSDPENIAVQVIKLPENKQ